MSISIYIKTKHLNTFISIIYNFLPYIQTSNSRAFSPDEFSSRSIQAKDNYDNFDQTIMNLEVSQIEDHINQAPQPVNHYGAVLQETCDQCFSSLPCN